MDPAIVLTVGLILLVLVAALHQWVLDSPLLELGAASWFPAGGDLSAATAVARGALAGVIPLAATIAAATLVLTAPFRVWLWGVVGLLAATVALSPVFAVYRYDVRPPTPGEAATFAGLHDLGCAVLVVTDARDGPVNGYAIGGPFRDVIGVSEFALANLPPAQVEALLAHEACHHRERHALIRGGASVAVLATGAAVATTLFDALVPAAALCLVAIVAVERVLAYWAMRRLEYRADAVAGRHTSEDAVVSLLAALDDATGVDQAAVPWLLELFSTHPSYADRIARVRERTSVSGEGRRPSSVPSR
jgi:Zn-dependent protease with chaperone function